MLDARSEAGVEDGSGMRELGGDRSVHVLAGRVELRDCSVSRVHIPREERGAQSTWRNAESLSRRCSSYDPTSLKLTWMSWTCKADSSAHRQPISVLVDPTQVGGHTADRRTAGAVYQSVHHEGPARNQILAHRLALLRFRAEDEDVLRVGRGTLRLEIRRERAEELVELFHDGGGEETNCSIGMVPPAIKIPTMDRFPILTRRTCPRTLFDVQQRDRAALTIDPSPPSH